MKQFIKHTIESAPEESEELLKYGEKNMVCCQIYS